MARSFSENAGVTAEVMHVIDLLRHDDLVPQDMHRVSRAEKTSVNVLHLMPDQGFYCFRQIALVPDIVKELPHDQQIV